MEKKKENLWCHLWKGCGFYWLAQLERGFNLLVTIDISTTTPLKAWVENLLFDPGTAILYFNIFIIGVRRCRSQTKPLAKNFPTRENQKLTLLAPDNECSSISLRCEEKDKFTLSSNCHSVSNGVSSFISPSPKK